MQWKNSSALWLMCVVGLSGCAGSGQVVRPPTELPKIAPPHPSLMITPTYGQQGRQLLFAPSMTPTSKSEDFRITPLPVRPL